MGSECVTELLSSNPAPLSFNAVNHKHWNFHCLLVKQSHYFFPHWKNLDLLFHWKFEDFSVENNYSMQFKPGVEISCFHLKNQIFYFFILALIPAYAEISAKIKKIDHSIFGMNKDISTSGINCILSLIFPILLISVNRQGIAF